MKFLLLIFMKTIIVFENGLKSGNVYFFFTQNLKIIETTIYYRRQKQFYQIFMFCQSNVLILKIQRYYMLTHFTLKQ